MQKHWIILVSLLSFGSTNYTLAGDMGTVIEQLSWKGLYLGGQLGGAWSHQDWNYTNSNYFNTRGSELLGNDFSFNAKNFIGGGYVGFNHQTLTPWLLGLEGSFSGSKLRSTEASPFFSTDRYTSSMNELGALKGRIGYRYDQWLPYVNGGWAFANTSLTLADPINNIQATTTPWNNGWVVGVGVEYRVTPKIAVGLTYDYSDININNQSMSCPSCGTGVGFGTPMTDLDFKTQAVMARLSYLLGQ